MICLYENECSNRPAVSWFDFYFEQQRERESQQKSNKNKTGFRNITYNSMIKMPVDATYWH